MRHSNQLRNEATDVGSCSFVSSNEPVKNGCEVIDEMFHTVPLKGKMTVTCELDLSSFELRKIMSLLLD